MPKRAMGMMAMMMITITIKAMLRIRMLMITMLTIRLMKAMLIITMLTITMMKAMHIGPCSFALSALHSSDKTSCSGGGENRRWSELKLSQLRTKENQK